MRNTTAKLRHLAKRLRHYKKINPAPKLEPYEGDSRHNYCHLVLFKDSKPHHFQVRSFQIREDKIVVSAVNWTLAAGTCTLDLTVKTINTYNIEILEDSPSLQTLYGT